jgi:hypothetical protein
MAEHASPSGECIICCSDLDNTNYAEFKGAGVDIWKPSPYCSECIEGFFKAQQWAKYLELFEKADCAAALRRVMSKPPPVTVHDKAFASDNNAEGVVSSFWYASTGSEESAKIVGALEGAARDEFWKEKTAALEAMEVAERESGDMALLAKGQAAPEH